MIPCISFADINFDSKILQKYFPNKAERDTVISYVVSVAIPPHKKQDGGYSIPKSSLNDFFADICYNGAGWDLSKKADAEKCNNFVKDIVYASSSMSSKYYEVCDVGWTFLKEDYPDARSYCVDNVFGSTQVTKLQAIGLAQEYARVKHNDEIECSDNIRQDGFIADDYIKCHSKTSPNFYEFKFDDVKESVDETIQQDIKEALCKIHNQEYQEQICTPYNNNIQCTVDYCTTKDENTCNKISASSARFGYKNEIRTGDFYGSGYCGFYTALGIYSKEHLQTAYDIPNDVFYSEQIQMQGSQALKDKLKIYVASKMPATEALTEFYCLDNPVQIGSIRGKSDIDDVLTCYANGNRIDFVFDDLSESNNLLHKGAQEAMTCIIAGGTFTGQRCANLNKEQCETVINSNTCPKCDSYWDAKNNICSLGNSTAAVKLQKGTTIAMIVSGAVVSVVITVGTAGAGGVTLGTTIVMVIETVGAGIEIAAQLRINGIADEFMVRSSNCQDETCAADLVEEYLSHLARLENDLTDTEISAIDTEMARLIGLIPVESNWWSNLLTSDKSLLSQSNDGDWTTAQVWRAVGVAMQLAGVLSSLGNWVISKSAYLSSKIPRTSQILVRNSKIAKQYIVNYDELDEVGKEWYRLWKEYAPSNQTFDDFKKMADGDLAKMQQMSSSWIPRSKRPIINKQINQQLEEMSADLRRRYNKWDDLMMKYNIDAYPENPAELAEIYKQHPDLEQAFRDVEYTREQIKKLNEAQEFYNNTSYSTYDPEFARFNKEIDELNERYKQISIYHMQLQIDDPNLNILEYEQYDDIHRGLFKKREELVTGYQWAIADRFSLKNMENLAQERAQEFKEILENAPDLKQQFTNWNSLTDQERLSASQELLNKYAQKTGTPESVIYPDYDTKWGGYYTPGTQNIHLNPKAITTSEDALDVVSHEHGHHIDGSRPNDGALGEQFASFVKNGYSNLTKAGYDVALTEQSSYTIGPKVVSEINNTPVYDSRLRKAEAEVQQQAINQLVREIGLPTVVTNIGITTGAATTQKNNKDKK